LSRGITVEVRHGNVEKAMRVLKKKLLKAGTLREYREKQYYRKPSEIKREKKKEGIKNYKKQQKLRESRL
jgi:small subunit ribosomal protein S21|tara:strand:- start:419 stop:628 length:210 start_codon:yes stop_codon:yes gene_type:complete